MFSAFRGDLMRQWQIITLVAMLLTTFGNEPSPPVVPTVSSVATTVPSPEPAAVEMPSGGLDRGDVLGHRRR